MKWKRINRRSVGGVQVRVLDPAVRVEQKVALPPRRDGFRRASVEGESRFIAWSHHDVLIVGIVEQRPYVAKSSECSLDRAPGRFLRDVIVSEPVRAVSAALPIHLREAAEVQICGDWIERRGFHETVGEHARRESLVPIDLHVGAEPNVMIGSRKLSGEIDDHRLVFAGREPDARYSYVPR